MKPSFLWFFRAGVIADNIYIYCASEGLATAVNGIHRHARPSKVMKPQPDQKIVLAQSVGYSKKTSWRSEITGWVVNRSPLCLSFSIMFISTSNRWLPELS
jgi:hypothetical protein